MLTVKTRVKASLETMKQSSPRRKKLQRLSLNSLESETDSMSDDLDWEFNVSMC
jgi:hypothetical protein